jgi:hypothetical protein
MPYQRALGPYRELIAGSIAGNIAPGEIMARVFDDG